MPVFRKRVRDAFMVISVFSEWPESLGSLLCQKHYLASLPRAYVRPSRLTLPLLVLPRLTPFRLVFARFLPSLLCCLLIYQQFRDDTSLIPLTTDVFGDRSTNDTRMETNNESLEENWNFDRG